VTESLLPVSAALLATAILVVILADRSARRPSAEEPRSAADRPREKVGFAGSFSLVRKNRYLLLLSGMILAGIIVSNLVHFQFQSVAKQSFPDKNSTTSFLATFNVVILVISYLFTTFLTSGLLRRFSLQVMLVIMPLLVGLGSVALFVPGLPLLVWAVTVKGSDKILTHSLMQSLREILHTRAPGRQLKARSSSTCS
jgi:ATP/ADP translocase